MTLPHDAYINDMLAIQREIAMHSGRNAGDLAEAHARIAELEKGLNIAVKEVKAARDEIEAKDAEISTLKALIRGEPQPDTEMPS